MQSYSLKNVNKSHPAKSYDQANWLVWSSRLLLLVLLLKEIGRAKLEVIDTLSSKTELSITNPLNDG